MQGLLNEWVALQMYSMYFFRVFKGVPLSTVIPLYCLQAFLDFRGFDLLRFIFLPFSNLDLRGFCFCGFFVYPHINIVNQGIPVHLITAPSKVYQ